MKNVIVFAIAVAFMLPASAFSSDQPGAQVYQKSCAVCHGSGAAGAPKLGDKEAWAPRIAEGISSLYQNALHGMGAMPPKGGSSGLSDDEVKAAVDFMVESSE